jgi:hypothetical protein
VERIEIELADDMTLGALRAIAKGMGKRLVISFGEKSTTRKVGRPARSRGAEPTPRRRGRRRKLGPEARAALVRNLAKARAVRAANLKAAKGAITPRKTKSAARETNA